MITVYGMSTSGNCHKIRLLLEQLGRTYRWIEIDSANGQTRTPEYLVKNPNGRVPMLELEDGRLLVESNAILCYLAEGSGYLPADTWQRAQALSWMFFEQYSHEPYVAVCRFQMFYLKKPASDLDPEKVKRGYAALARMEHQLAITPFLAGDAVTLADISLLAYTRLAHEGGFHLDGYAAVRRWIGATEKLLGLPPAR